MVYIRRNPAPSLFRFLRPCPSGYPVTTPFSHVRSFVMKCIISFLCKHYRIWQVRIVLIMTPSCHFNHCLLCLVAKFFNDPQAFLECLRPAEGVISGSAALKLLFSWENHFWDANDLNVYMALERIGPLVDFLSTSGFTHRAVHHSSLYSTRSITSIQVFHQGGQTRHHCIPLFLCH